MKLFLKVPAVVLFTITIFLALAPNFDEDVQSGKLSIVTVYTVLLNFILLGWYFSIGTILNVGAEKEVKQFRYNCVFLLSFIIVLLILLTLLKSLLEDYVLIVVIAVFYYIYVFFKVIFYCSRCLSKHIDKTVNSPSIIGYVFLLWFFPIGIWIIQPKINVVMDRIGE